MLRNIIMGEYCMKLSKYFFTVTNAEGKLIFYFIVKELDFLLECNECDSLSFYPKTISYDPDMSENKELMDYVSKVLFTDDRSVSLHHLINLFELVRKQPYFDSICPGDYINNYKGLLNYNDYKFYVENYLRVSSQLKKTIKIDEPYSMYVNDFQFHCLHSYILSNDKKHDEISRNEFEQLIPNDKTANAYIQIYNERNKFFCCETKDKKRSQHLIVTTDDRMELYVEIKKRK